MAWEYQGADAVRDLATAVRTATGMLNAKFIEIPDDQLGVVLIRTEDVRKIIPTDTCLTIYTETNNTGETFTITEKEKAEKFLTNIKRTFVF
ncbi:MAG: hypothetical protein DRN30_03225 [Thermoplasmata archaeon]|nr:MAG: hypothetical protein DRN30_03225 [Thermoplasmata archaeon]